MIQFLLDWKVTALLSGAERSAAHCRQVARPARTPCQATEALLRHVLLDSLGRGQEVAQTEHGQGKRRQTVLFLLQVLLSEMAILNISSHRKSTLSVSLNFFFMFYMNNSNLLIKITELSIEKVSS